MEHPDHTTSEEFPAAAPGGPSGIQRALGAHTASASLLRSTIGEAAPGPFGEGGPFCNLEELFSQVSHFGKNLLGPIKGYTSLIQDDSSDGENAHRWATKIMRNVESLEQYLDRLAMLRVRGATAEGSATWSDLIGRALDRCRHVNGGATIEVRNETSAAFRQKTELLVRALFQVVRNACEAAGPSGRVWLSVGEARVAGGGGIVREFRVEVRDDGEGMEPNRIEHIWKPFYTTRHDHLGLGLTYVAAAAPVVGMDVDVESATGGGTRVVLTLREQQGGQGEAQTADRR